MPATSHLIHLPVLRHSHTPIRLPHIYTSKCSVLPHSGPAEAEGRHTHTSLLTFLFHPLSFPLATWHLLGLGQSWERKALPCPSRVQHAQAPPPILGRRYPEDGGSRRPPAPTVVGGSAPGRYLRLPRRGVGWETRLVWGRAPAAVRRCCAPGPPARSLAGARFGLRWLPPPACGSDVSGGGACGGGTGEVRPRSGAGEGAPGARGAEEPLGSVSAAAGLVLSFVSRRGPGFAKGTTEA